MPKRPPPTPAPAAVLPPTAKSKPAPPAFIDPNSRYTYEEGSAALRQSRSRTFEDVREGRLKVIREGRRAYIPGSELIRRSTLPA